MTTLSRLFKASFAAAALIGATFGSGQMAARADALDDIAKAGVLKVGVFGDFPPFSSVTTDMSLKGYDIDVAQILADALKTKVSLVTVTGQNRIPYLTEHRVDILLSVGQSAEREKVIDFTDAYAPYYIAVMGPKALKVEGKADLAGKSIAVNRGTLEDSSLTEAAPAGADIRRFDNYNSVIQAFLSGQTQLMVVGNDVGADVLSRQAALQPEQKFQLLTSPDHIALNKNEPRLKQLLNETVAKIRGDGSLNAISLKWLKKPLDSKTSEAVEYSLDFGWLGGALTLIGSGALMTVVLIVATTVFGTLIAIFGAALRRGSAPSRRVVASYVELIRNTPFLAQLFFIYFGLPSLGIRLDPVIAAILAMTINLSAYGIEIVGAGLDAVSKGQREAGLALGLRPRRIFLSIVLPQALKVIFPALASQIVITMLELAVVSQIAVRELTYEADLLQARTFRSFETYLVVTAVYLALSVGLRRLLIAGDRAFLPAGPR